MNGVRPAPWLVLISREQQVEVTVFSEESEARAYFEQAKSQWSDSYLLRAVEFPMDWVGTS